MANFDFDFFVPTEAEELALVEAIRKDREEQELLYLANEEDFINLSNETEEEHFSA